MPSHLLPKNATQFEIAVSEGSDVLALTRDSISSMRGLKIINPPPPFLPYLIYEYGLGELTPYVPNLYDLIDEGIDWQRIRGTPAAVAMALAWVGYAAEIEEPAHRRKRWNLFQLALNRLRDAESDLPRIEGVTRLSVPVRSVFWRGFHGYDIRALDYGWTRWSRTRWSAYSGVRLAGGQAKWSFGRRYAVDHEMTQAELTALGVWLEPPEGDAPLKWGAFPWPASPWGSSAARARSVAMLEAVDLGTCWAVFKNAAGGVIGYRRARAVHTVQQQAGGIYQVGASRYALRPSGATILLLEAMTGFGDGFGNTAATVGFILNASPTSAYPPGSLWLPAGGLQQVGPIVAETSISIEFGRTVRERIGAVLRF